MLEHEWQFRCVSLRCLRTFGDVGPRAGRPSVREESAGQ